MRIYVLTIFKITVVAGAEDRKKQYDDRAQRE